MSHTMHGMLNGCGHGILALLHALTLTVPVIEICSQSWLGKIITSFIHYEKAKTHEPRDTFAQGTTYVVTIS